MSDNKVVMSAELITEKVSQAGTIYHLDVTRQRHARERKGWYIGMTTVAGLALLTIPINREVDLFPRISPLPLAVVVSFGLAAIGGAYRERKEEQTAYNQATSTATDVIPLVDPLQQPNTPFLATKTWVFTAISPEQQDALSENIQFVGRVETALKPSES